MDFLLYEPEDFASDESYLRYYFRLNENDVMFWQDWISKHPEKLDCIINADQLISLLSLHLDETEFSQEHHRLQAAIELSATKHELLFLPADIAGTSSENIITRRRRIKIFALAALVCSITVAAYLHFSDGKKGLTLTGIQKTQDQGMQQKLNSGATPLKFQLEDGSIITLQPGSTLNYPRKFLPAKREVYLEGEAFFEVTKNKNRPFYVYCQNLVAHVLGTSFNIRSDQRHSQVEVAVTTGKVEVYENHKNHPADKNNQSTGLILTPNQKAVYLENDKKFESSLVDVPLPISYGTQDTRKDSTVQELVYKNPTPMLEILNTLGKDYGIEIEVENENLYNCHFSGPLSDLNLYLKLDAICQMVNATYEVKGTKILIRGAGCN